MQASASLLRLVTTLYVVAVVSMDVNGEYFQLTVLNGDLVLDTTTTVADAPRSVVKRATLDEQSRPSAVEQTLNSLRRQKKNVANMYYVVRTHSWALLNGGSIWHS